MGKKSGKNPCDRAKSGVKRSLLTEAAGIAVGLVIEKYARKARIKKHVTCHLWRHTCATHLLKNNANLRHVQEMLGHRSLATTERYLRLTITDLKEAHRKFHPREKSERARSTRSENDA